MITERPVVARTVIDQRVHERPSRAARYRAVAVHCGGGEELEQPPSRDAASVTSRVRIPSPVARAVPCATSPGGGRLPKGPPSRATWHRSRARGCEWLRTSPAISWASSTSRRPDPCGRLMWFFQRLAQGLESAPAVARASPRRCRPARDRSRWLTGRSSTPTVTSSADSRPARHRSATDLPVPDSPVMRAKPPSWTSCSTRHAKCSIRGRCHEQGVAGQLGRERVPFQHPTAPSSFLAFTRHLRSGRAASWADTPAAVPWRNTHRGCASRAGAMAAGGGGRRMPVVSRQCGGRRSWPSCRADRGGPESSPRG